MKVLVTGAAGFLAPHVAKHLSSAGHEVVLTDVQNSDGPDPIALADLTSLEDMLRVTLGVDAICHLGGVGDVYLAAEQPYLAASANVLGTATLLEACRINRLRKVVYASTWEVYGPPVCEPIDEDHPCNPDHPYNITKLAGERLTIAYDNLKDLPGLALRLGTAYGPGMRPNSVFSRFIQKALDGEPIVIAGTGEQTRQFTHVQDIADAFLRGLESPVRNQVFNIVSEETTSIRAVAEFITGRLPNEIQFGPERPGDVVPARISADRAHSVLGWTADTDFQAGLSDLIDSYLGQPTEVEARQADEISRSH